MPNNGKTTYQNKHCDQGGSKLNGDKVPVEVGTKAEVEDKPGVGVETEAEVEDKRPAQDGTQDQAKRRRSTRAGRQEKNQKEKLLRLNTAKEEDDVRSEA